MKAGQVKQLGLSLVEMMIAITVGVMLSTATIAVYLAQTQTYKTTASQAFIQNTENAISEIITPYIRNAGFAGCSNVITGLSNLNTGGSAPLGSINTNPSMIMGYSANTNLSTLNANNETNASRWTPSLDSGLVGLTEAGSDVLVILGPIPGFQPVGVTAYTQSSNAFSVQSTTGVTAGQYASISDCVKSTIFLITAVSSNAVTHAAGTGTLANANSAFAVNYPTGSQFLPLQQNAFFVGQGQGGQSSLMIATLNGSTWTAQALVPGVDMMRVLYGIGNNANISQYVDASGVTDWGKVYAIRLGFLVEGQLGSGDSGTSFTVLDKTVTIPRDSRLRHVYELTINLRNQIS